ncbi:peptidylprolyl isomerase [Granulicella tundricola]|uniref:Periplasmic chaperone PpiD n=1 Tax=Granulicella tundricola (strain ATCC BAA-1859 / DSM 23138 / MP5ACTX9) TaxID=1198114 RepID=E8X4E1_GRATM|nr:peptidylprolyl isomerase [Granulicella tundricola]ADW68268.1 PpiC-type peptidyl-prolyl cis-trans isomerase [Granulicella tundricola MP5ACTX9]
MIRIFQQDNKFVKLAIASFITVALGAMVITLVPGIFDNVDSGGSGVNYATVHAPGLFGRFGGDSEPVLQTEVTRAATQQLEQQKLPPMLMPYIESRVAQQLVQEAILKLEADRLGLQVADSDLLRELHQGQIGQILFPNGQYIGDDAYMNFVQNQLNMTRGDFEILVKKEMEVARLQALITGGVTVSDNAVRDSYRVSGTKVKFDYAVITSDTLRATVNPSDSDLQTFFKTNQARYATAVPESRKLNYFAFGADQIPGGKPQVTDADLQTYYNAHLAQYQVKDQAKVRHILIAVPAGADARTDAAAKAKADDLLKQIKAGGNFADLASKNSDDPGSKANGGELGFLSPGQTVPEFDKASFSLKPGQTSDVIKTKFGYHILQVEERQNAHTKPLNEVKAEITPIVEQQKFGNAEAAYAKSLSDEARKNGIDKTAAAHGLHATTTDFVGKDGVVPGVSDSTALLAQAFTTTKKGDPISVSTGDGFAIFQVVDIQAPHAPTFDAYKSHILDDYRAEKVPQLLNEKLNKLDARAKELNDLHKAAAELNIPVKSSDLVGKDGQVPDLGAMSGPGAPAFDLAKGTVSNPINTGSNGIVLVVTDKQEPSADDIAKNFTATREGLLNERREEVFRLYLGTLTEKYQKSGGIRYAKKTNAPGAPGSSPLGL